MGAGRFRLEGGATPANLVEVASTNEDIATRIDRDGDRAMVRLRQDVAWWPDAWRNVSDWSVRIASDVPTYLTMNAGAGDFQIDLAEVILAGARIQVGAAQARLVMPRPRGPIEIRVKRGSHPAPVQRATRRRVPGRDERRPDVRRRPDRIAGLRDRERPVLVRFSGGATSLKIG